MDVQAAHTLALTLMKEHGLLDVGWRFRWSHGKRQLGAATIRRVRRRATGQVEQIKTIRLSKHLVRLNDEDEVRDTILHEIAHALAGLKHGHDAVWKAMCVRIGAKPQRLAGEAVNVVDARYTILCGCCEQAIARRYRRVNVRRLKRSYCRTCGPRSTGQLWVHDAAAMKPLGLFQQLAQPCG